MCRAIFLLIVSALSALSVTSCAKNEPAAPPQYGVYSEALGWRNRSNLPPCKWHSIGDKNAAAANGALPRCLWYKADAASGAVEEPQPSNNAFVPSEVHYTSFGSGSSSAAKCQNPAPEKASQSLERCRSLPDINDQSDKVDQAGRFATFSYPSEQVNASELTEKSRGSLLRPQDGS